MAHFLWKGPGKMEEVDLQRAVAPTVTAPVEVDVPVGGAPAKEQRFVCNVEGCKGKKFKIAGLAARHFNSSHHDLYVDKDTWRAHISEVWE